MVAASKYVLFPLALVELSSVAAGAAARNVEVYFISSGVNETANDTRCDLFLQNALNSKELIDPPLVVAAAPAVDGELQAMGVQSALSNWVGDSAADKIAWISSPLTRAVQTLALGMPNGVENATVHLWPDLTDTDQLEDKNIYQGEFKNG